ncbi:hypothetical protein B0J12DRAFT_745123 [Macrophomina phaseolina]|uniref:Uncharacterized protein n=1 Tax=Macrophomina phaseolina TaxID=35725 RepID=A0ABQ8FX24_9PEZI|nr:hypothetical protein B0J12DRAFT_745123 [Macrophomina phaseolina]
MAAYTLLNGFLPTSIAMRYSLKIHLGTWTNRSRGPVLGATLTLTRRDGALTAFVALFVTIVGTSSWRFSCLAANYIYSTEAPRDGPYHKMPSYSTKFGK